MITMWIIFLLKCYGAKLHSSEKQLPLASAKTKMNKSMQGWGFFPLHLLYHLDETLIQLTLHKRIDVSDLWSHEIL